jgi:hypothetical protein
VAHAAFNAGGKKQMPSERADKSGNLSLWSGPRVRQNHSPRRGFVTGVGQRLLNCSHANLICCQLGFASIECLSLFPRQMPGLLLSRELSGRRGLLT